MHFDSERPVFLQVAEKMEDAILTGAFEEDQQVHSTTELLSLIHLFDPV